MIEEPHKRFVKWRKGADHLVVVLLLTGKNVLVVFSALVLNHDANYVTGEFFIVSIEESTTADTGLQALVLLMGIVRSINFVLLAS